MAGYFPATGTTIVMGRVYRGYTNVIPTGGTNVRLSATLGASYGGRAAGLQIGLSSWFGGRYYPYTY